VYLSIGGIVVCVIVVVLIIWLLRRAR